MSAHAREPRRLLAWAPPILWALFVLWLGGQSIGPPVQIRGLDKVAHVFLYGVLGLLAGRAWRRAGRAPAAFLVIALACGVGIADELHQTRVSSRTADPFDFVADAAGVLLGFAVGRRRPALGRNVETE